MKRSLTLVALLLLTTGAVFAKGPKGDGPHGGMGKMGGGDNCPQGMGKMGMMPFFPGAYLAGVDEIHQKYAIQFKKIQLETEEQTLPIRNELKDTMFKLRELSADYAKGEKVSQKDVAALLKKTQDAKDKMQAIHEKSRDKMMKLNDQQKAEVDKAISEWISKIEKDPAEFEKFMKATSMTPGPGPGPGMGQGPEKGKAKNK